MTRRKKIRCKKKEKRKRRKNTRDKNLKTGYAVGQIFIIDDIIARGSQLKQLLVEFSGRLC